MAVVNFVVVESFVSDGSNSPVPGTYLAGLKQRLTTYWADMSGGRVQVAWAMDVQVVLTQTLAEWKELGTAAKIDEARAQGRIPAGTNIVLVANDAEVGSASTPGGSSPYVHVTWLSAAVVAHEMGHFFEWAGSARAGHADVARTFFRDEYGDPTCIMGGEDNKYSFRDALIPAIPLKPASTRSGPAMNPALVDQCGWLDLGSPQVAMLDRTALGSVVLQPWTGAPADGAAGTPRVAVIDGARPDGERLYVCVRAAVGWDRGFSARGSLTPFRAGTPARWICAYLATTASDSLLLASRYAVPNDSIHLEMVPIRIRVGEVSAEGVSLEFFRDPWRGSAPIEGVECDPHAQVTVAAWGATADMYVIDRAGAVRYNHFNGHGWEHLPWPVIDGVTCDPLGGIAAAARSEGLVDVFVIDRDGTVRRRQRRHREWSPDWQVIQGGGLDPQSSLAAARVDDRSILLCGVRPDRQVSRTLVDADGNAANWESAPQFSMRRVAATPAEEVGGRIYATAVNNPDRTIWDTPDIDASDPGQWLSVGSLVFDESRPIGAALMPGADDLVLAGTDPLTVLFWTGTEWRPETLPALDREPEGGLAAFSMEAESFHGAWIDTTGTVNVFGWSPRPEFRPATNQYQAESTVVFQAATGHLVQAKGGGGDGMGADSQNLGAWEKLRMREFGTYVINAGATRRVVVFQTHDGHYVGAVGGGGSHLIAQATAVGPWEKFYLHELGNNLVTLGCIDEIHFWTANGGGGAALAADKSEEKEWERFVMVPVAP
jgi:hypothetical protein